MRIYSMTATFGKLEHETLTLEPGLNVISAPNEWGKSTWCAFLTAMLYGLDTRAKSTKNSLADKERYAPWSGSPMAGRIDLNWEGRDITIERSTRRRVPLGEFRAYETASGLPVEELTAANCGQMLLGVEQSVYRRSGFIRSGEMPVTQDEALRRRLNALVTTGDENAAADRLADNLRDLKNRCRYNRTGLIPQAEQEREAIKAKLRELGELQEQSAALSQQLQALDWEIQNLENHQQALSYQSAQTAAAQMEQARLARDQAQRELYDQEAVCAGLPTKEKAQESLQQVRQFQSAWAAAQEREPQQLPPMPELSGPFAGMDAQAAREMAHRDGRKYGTLASSKIPLILLAIGAGGLLAAIVLAVMKVYLFGAAAGLVALGALVWGMYEQMNTQKQMQALAKKYGTADVTHWADPIRVYEAACKRYTDAAVAIANGQTADDTRLSMLRRQKQTLCGDREPETVAQYWQRVVAAWESCQSARREYQRAQSHLEAIQAMVRPVESPQREDLLDYSENETAQRLNQCTMEQQRLQNRLGQHQGRMNQLGDSAALEQELERKNRRISKLEDTYAALALAQETLEQARTELQRRFAPRITQRAQELMSAMTAGRYHSLSMGVDFSLQAGAGTEEVLSDAIWRSDGTMDQLYLALRLAVAEELTPQAPLVLDDALVRFDDQRMKEAMKVLSTLAQQRQILLFTCQSREKQAI